jgi:hypothetical protein
MALMPKYVLFVIFDRCKVCLLWFVCCGLFVLVCLLWFVCCGLFVVVCVSYAVITGTARAEVTPDNKAKAKDRW